MPKETKQLIMAMEALADFLYLSEVVTEEVSLENRELIEKLQVKVKEIISTAAMVSDIQNAFVSDEAQTLLRQAIALAESRFERVIPEVKLVMTHHIKCINSHIMQPVEVQTPVSTRLLVEKPESAHWQQAVAVRHSGWQAKL